MFLFVRLINSHSIRHSSRARTFYANLKKLYRSTTSNLFMDTNQSHTCFVFDKDESTKFLIQMIYEMPTTRTRRKFNLLRSVDESVSQTIKRLTANVERVAKKENKSVKRRKKQEDYDDTSLVNQQEQISVQLLDEQNQPIDENTTNQKAWTTCKKLVINGQTYQVEYNAPAVIKFRFPEVVMTNTITTALVDLDYGEWKDSIFDWYVADEVKGEENDENDAITDDSQWTHVHRGPFCVFQDEHANKFVRLACLPRNSSLREGMQAAFISKKRIIPLPVDLPMDTRHELTKEFLPSDSNSFRIVSYNILANGYATSSDAGDRLYPYCPSDYLEFDYRKPLLLREIIGYHADIISLQECDTRFFDRELSLVLNDRGYLGKMKIKSESVGEGSAIFYRKDRFREIAEHNITIGEYFRNCEALESLRQRCAALSEINQCLLERTTALQILAVQLQGDENEIFLLCNTHLYFHPRADVVRCLQAMISFERIRETKHFYEQQNKNVSIIWCGDFNANVTSLAFHLLFTGALVTDTNHRSYNENYSTLINDFTYRAPIELSTYSNYSYTNYMMNFHDVIDHIFFEGQKFEFQRTIPMPMHDEVTKFVALPSCIIPSDHLALIVELNKIR